VIPKSASKRWARLESSAAITFAVIKISRSRAEASPIFPIGVAARNNFPDIALSFPKSDSVRIIPLTSSNPVFLKSHYDYKNVIIIQSEYPGRGELLPYIYYAKYNWFDKAVIIHDSVFFYRRIPFEKIKLHAVPLWHFDKVHNKTHLDNTMRIIKNLNYSALIQNCFLNNNKWTGCFGVQTFIKRNFLLYVMNKYNVSNLIPVVTCRDDRCCMERIMAILFYLELKTTNLSILGNITRSGLFGKYNYDKMIEEVKKHKLSFAVVKIFTGR
jgi:hypothetical protein